LYRDPDDTIVTGLSAGLAHYMGVDPWFVRSIWLVLGVLGIFHSRSIIFLSSVLLFYLVNFCSKSKNYIRKVADVRTTSKH
jgi:phage shock protein PspC (stress-responsive transcriptional regulator)